MKKQLLAHISRALAMSRSGGDLFGCIGAVSAKIEPGLWRPEF
ncbi:hypothetical protein HNR65_001368 [Desulfosalsimonas propionicica]|uniref:Uncharacterized protein n=1 Tax=Desulfosalsimonas propionicica TaxID=332175 RepID=A0A7W0HKB4_9BACT|nr:hypothetical protein [Desulfosalsimonas propionicica]MBA2881042.1 hypothetical protein [Desulfosalsimonas propionicica]